MLCIPGGTGCVAAIENPRFLAAIRRLAGDAKHLTSVCTGSLILAAAGLLAGRRAACHWAWRDMLKAFGAIPDGGRVVRDGNIITGGGVTAGIDFALTLIAQLRGAHVAQSIQLLLEYAPEPPFDAGLPETAPPLIREAVLERMAGTLTDAEQRIGRVARHLRA
jgi:cyclohexyl-isocyanide hydratase